MPGNGARAPRRGAPGKCSRPASSVDSPRTHPVFEELHADVVCGVSKLKMEQLMKGVMPFLIAELIVLFLLVLFPQLVTVPAAWFGR